MELWTISALRIPSTLQRNEITAMYVIAAIIITIIIFHIYYCSYYFRKYKNLMAIITILTAMYEIKFPLSLRCVSVVLFEKSRRNRKSITILPRNPESNLDVTKMND